MSRFGASLGASVGFVGGAIAGAMIGNRVEVGADGSLRYVPSVDGSTVTAIGALVGTVVGAALGAGSSEAPKQVGTSGAPAGALDLYVGDGGVFP